MRVLKNAPALAGRRVHNDAFFLQFKTCLLYGLQHYLSSNKPADDEYISNIIWSINNFPHEACHKLHFYIGLYDAAATVWYEVYITPKWIKLVVAGFWHKVPVVYENGHVAWTCTFMGPNDCIIDDGFPGDFAQIKDVLKQNITWITPDKSFDGKRVREIGKTPMLEVWQLPAFK